MGDGKFSARARCRTAPMGKLTGVHLYIPIGGWKHPPTRIFSAAIDRTEKPCYNEGAFLIEEKHMAKKKGAGGKLQPYDERDGRYIADYTSMGTQELRERQIIELPEEEQTLHLPDEILPRSLSARWANYEITLPNGKKAHFAEGSRIQNKEVFAGKGCKRKIDEEDRLVRISCSYIRSSCWQLEKNKSKRGIGG